MEVVAVQAPAAAEPTVMYSPPVRIETRHVDSTKSIPSPILHPSFTHPSPIFTHPSPIFTHFSPIFTHFSPSLSSIFFKNSRFFAKTQKSALLWGAWPYIIILLLLLLLIDLPYSRAGAAWRNPMVAEWDVHHDQWTREQ